MAALQAGQWDGGKDDALVQRQAVDDHVEKAADDEADDDREKGQRFFHRNILWAVTVPFCGS